MFVLTVAGLIIIKIVSPKHHTYPYQICCNIADLIGNVIIVIQLLNKSRIGLPLFDPIQRIIRVINDVKTRHADVLKTIRETRDFGDDAKKGTVAALEAFAKQFA